MFALLELPVKAIEVGPTDSDTMVRFLTGTLGSELSEALIEAMIADADLRKSVNSTRKTLRKLQAMPLQQLSAATSLLEAEIPVAQAWLDILEEQNRRSAAVSAANLANKTAAQIRELLAETKTAIKLIAEQFRMRMAMATIATARGQSIDRLVFALRDDGTTAELTTCQCDAAGTLTVEAQVKGKKSAVGFRALLSIGRAGAAIPTTITELTDENTLTWYVPGIGSEFDRVSAPFPVDWIQITSLDGTEDVLVPPSDHTLLAALDSGIGGISPAVSLKLAENGEQWIASLRPSACIAFEGRTLVIEAELLPGNPQLIARLAITEDGLEPTPLQLPQMSSVIPAAAYIRARVTSSQ